MTIEKQRKLDYGMTFGSDQGKNVLADLANRFNLFSPHTISDPMVMAYEEGQRSVVLYIIETAATNYDDRKRQILEELKHGR
jgi:hypothetical protein